MTASELAVFLDGTLAGALTQSTAGSLEFRYDDAYRSRADATPLSLSIPLASAAHKARIVRPWLQGLLPDSEEALRALGRRFGVSPANPFALLEHVGADAAGAVQILPPGQVATDASGEQQTTPVTAAEVAAMLDRVVAEYRDGIIASGPVGRFSVAGAQPKIALAREPDGAWSLPLGSMPTTHIVKPVVGAFRRVDVVEQLTLRAAESLGCEVAAAQLDTIGNWHVLVSRRYDRVQTPARWHRRHQEDLCQALSVPPEKKYQHHDGGPGIAKIAQLLSSLPRIEDRTAAAAAFYRAFVFNVVAGCTDAHAKNYSLLLDGRSVALAPLYDLLTYAGYWDGAARLDSAMSVEGEYALNRISFGALVRVGTRFGVVLDEAAEIVATIRDGMVDAFEVARDSVQTFGADAVAIADAVLRGVRRLPLVAR